MDAFVVIQCCFLMFGFFIVIDCATSILNSGTITVAEDAGSSSAACSTTLSAVDATSSVSLFYSIFSASPSSAYSIFTINSTNILACLNNPAGFNYYVTPAYTLTIYGCCASSGTATVSTTITISITEKSVGPFFNSSLMTTTMSEATSVGSSIYTLSTHCYARPNSGHSLSFAFNGTSDPYFSITSGVVQVKSLYSLDYPSTLPLNYNMYILCSDTSYSTTATGTLAVTISDTDTFTPVFNLTTKYYTLTTVDANQYVGSTPAYDYDRSSTYNQVSYSVGSDSVSALFKYPTATSSYLTTAQSFSSITNGTNLTVTIYAKDSGGLSASTTIVVYYYAGVTTTSTSTTTSTTTTTTTTTTTAVTTTSFASSSAGIATIVICSVLGAAALAVGLYFISRQSQIKPKIPPRSSIKPYRGGIPRGRESMVQPRPYTPDKKIVFM